MSRVFARLARTGQFVPIAIALWLASEGVTAAAAQGPPGTAYVGRTVTKVQVEVQGREVVEPTIQDLLEIQPNEPLSLLRVRDSVARLAGLGRYQDIQVEAIDDGPGVALRFVLVPLRAVRRVVFRGTLGLPPSRLRRALEERFGGTPTWGRLGAAVQAIEETYLSAGYAHARVVPAIEATLNALDTEMAFDIDAGVRARIGRVSVTGTPQAPPDEVLDRLSIRSGELYDRDELDRALGRYVQSLRERRYYEATARQTAEFRENGTLIDLTLDLRSGPLVTLSFEGDPLPADRLDEFVPIAREGSADLDLLEDSDLRIRQYLGSEGYWQADVTHRRTLTDDRLEVVFTVKKGMQARVADVDIVGNHAVSSGDLRPLVRFQPGDLFMADRLDADVAAIETHYRRLGYAQVKVTSSVALTMGATSGGVLVRPRITVEEGTRVLIGRILVEGAQGLTESDVRAVMRSISGGPLYPPQLADDRDAVTLLYLDHGYQSAQVAIQRVFREGGAIADVVVRIQAGPQSVIDHVLIVGNSRTKTAAIAREVTLNAGDPLGLSAINESRRRLSALGLFRGVRITAMEHGGGARRDLLVVVEEAPATTLDYGGGVEGRLRLRSNPEGGPAVERLEVAPRGFLEIGRRNLWGKNRSIDLFTRAGGRLSSNPGDTSPFTEYRVLGTYREPRAFWFHANFLANAVLEQGIRTGFNFNRRGVNTELSRPLTAAVRVSGRYAFSYTRRFAESINPKDLSLIDRLFPQVRLSTFSGSVARDTRDDPVDPTQGTLAIADGEFALRAVGSEVGFTKTYLQGFLFRNVFEHENRRVVAAFGARLGLATGFPRDVVVTDAEGNPVLGPDGVPLVQRVRDVPASERFFAGGDTTVRGFTIDRLGTAATIDQNGFPKGGNAMIVLNAELRMQLRRGLGVVGFLDAGNVFPRLSDLGFSDVRASPGFGLRYQSPIGPIRIDLGFKLQREPWERRRVVFHFSFGQAF